RRSQQERARRTALVQTPILPPLIRVRTRRKRRKTRRKIRRRKRTRKEKKIRRTKRRRLRRRARRRRIKRRKRRRRMTGSAKPCEGPFRTSSANTVSSSRKITSPRSLNSFSGHRKYERLTLTSLD
ncbi:unnamed protein product, partial [Symbiodinium pilosum]